MNSHFDAIVIGAGGAMGSAACYELALRGVKVLGLDRFGIAHDRGSSHGRSRMIRTAYYEHPNYVPLLRRAVVKWRDLEKRSEQKLFWDTGGLYTGPRGCELVERSASAARQHGIAHELLDRAQIAARFPQFVAPDDFVALLEPGAGFIAPEAAIEAFAKQAMLAGAVIHGHEPMGEWSAEPDRAIVVTTDRAAYTADRLILTAGAWMSELNLDIKLTVTRQVMGWVRPRDPAPFALDRFICWAIAQPDGSLYYGFPMRDDEPGVRVSHHKPGEVTTPETIRREVTQADADSIDKIVRRVLPSATGPIVLLQTCMYTNSADSHFVIGQLPRDPRVVFACGFSGHGFKFASVMGEILADLTTRGETDLPIGFLSPTRFGWGKANT